METRRDSQIFTERYDLRRRPKPAATKPPPTSNMAAGSGTALESAATVVVDKLSRIAPALPPSERMVSNRYVPCCCVSALVVSVNVPSDVPPGTPRIGVVPVYVNLASVINGLSGWLVTSISMLNSHTAEG